MERQRVLQVGEILFRIETNKGNIFERNTKHLRKFSVDLSDILRRSSDICPSNTKKLKIFKVPY